MAIFHKEQGAYTPPQAPFAGWSALPDGRLQPAIPGPHVLVSGPSGVGKSRRVLGPGIMIWRGPVVAISSKPDLVDLCIESRVRRGAEHTYVLDFSGEVPTTSLPDGVEKVRLDPTALIATADDALTMAEVLLQTGTAGAGGKSGGGGNDAFWTTTSTGPLAGILRAAPDIAWARDAVGSPEVSEDITDEDAIVEMPCWANAADRLEAMDENMLAAQVRSAISLDDRMRDSIGVTMRGALAPWLRSTVAGAGERVFTPALLEHGRASLFMVAPADGVAAGAAVAAVDFISRRWRANQTEEERLPRLLMCVDELCNTLPWAKLPVVVTESRAMGINLLVAVQSTEQFSRRYGHDGRDELRTIFPSVLLLTGAPEREMVERAAWWSGKREVTTQTLGADTRQSYAQEMRDIYTPQSLLPNHVGEGRLLRGKQPGDSGPATEAGVRVMLVDISEIDGIH